MTPEKYVEISTYIALGASIGLVIGALFGGWVLAPFIPDKWWRKRLRWDRHPGPHLMYNGGCYCICEECSRPNAEGSYRCVCPRCDQNCTGTGRIGSKGLILSERSHGMPQGGKPARRLYWSDK